MKNNPIKNAYAIFINHVGVTMIWLIFSLLTLLVMFGAATTSAFALAFKIQEDKEPVDLIKDFFKELKRNVVPSTIVFLVSVMLYILLFFAWNFSINTGDTILYVATIVSTIYLTVFSLHVYPLIAKFEHASAVQLIKNTLLFMHLHFLLTIKLSGTLVLFIAIIVFIHPTLFIPGLAVFLFINTYHLRPIYKRYIERFKEEKDNE